MALIQKISYTNNVKENKMAELYIDSINEYNYMHELYGIIIRYIRTKTNTIMLFEDLEKDHIAKDENDIYYNRPVGYWIVKNSNKSITLYNKTLTTGYIYNSTYIERLFDLEIEKCPKVIPQIKKKTTHFEDFTTELKTNVEQFKNRHQR